MYVLTHYLYYILVYSIKNIPENSSLSNKSKKIQREVAKKRTQIKKAKSITNSIQIKEEEQSQLLIQDELNNSNVDEKSGKKLKQMIRNRISAQNSRDRKKTYINNLEKNSQYLKMQNTQLLNEIIALKEANKLLNNDKEELKKLLKKQAGFCSHCGYSSLSPNLTDDHISIPTTNMDDTEFECERENGVNSPVFSRLLNGSPRSFLSYMLTVATVLSLVLILNTSNTNEPQDIMSKFYVVSQNTTNTGI